MIIELDNVNQEEASCICGATDIASHRILARDEISSEIVQIVRAFHRVLSRTKQKLRRDRYALCAALSMARPQATAIPIGRGQPVKVKFLCTTSYFQGQRSDFSKIGSVTTTCSNLAGCSGPAKNSAKDQTE